MWKHVAIVLGMGAAVLLLAFGAAHVYADQSRSVADIMAEIRQAQGLSQNQSIDCGKVTDQQFEEMGEAWMDVMVPDPQQHEMMDRMMGGPGSTSLANAHRMMGARYLGCLPAGADGMMMPGMMGLVGGGFGGNMMGYGSGPGAQYGGRMTGGYHYGDGGWMHTWGGGIIMWIILLVVIGLVIYLIVGSGHHRRDTYSEGSKTTESAQEILKKRYVRGEISKEDFERMKKDIS